MVVMSSPLQWEQLACGQLSCRARSLMRWIKRMLAWGLGLLQPVFLKDQAHLHHEKVLHRSLRGDPLRGSSQTGSSPPALPAGKVVLGLHLPVSRLLANGRVEKVVQESTTLSGVISSLHTTKYLTLKKQWELEASRAGQPHSHRLTLLGSPQQ